MRAPSGGAAWAAPPECPSEVGQLVAELLDGLVAALGAALEAVYLRGSLVCGDFRPQTSDVDLVVVVERDVDDAQLGRLAALHDALAQAHPDWSDRVDAVYVPAFALHSFPERKSPLVVISPGEPLHRTRSDPGWGMNWHLVREHGATLFGPPPRSSIRPATQQEFEAAIRSYLPELPARVERSRAPGFAAYAVLTVCRGLYTCSQGHHTSKTQAALWAADRHPAWSDVIRRALDWRDGPRDAGPGGGASEREIAFVRFGVGQLQDEPLAPTTC